MVALAAALLISLGGRAEAASSDDCAPAPTRAQLGAFLAAFNAGDAETLDAILAPAETFVWYTMAPPSGRSGEASKNRATLMAYFAKRHGRGEQLKLLKLIVHPSRRVGVTFLTGFQGDLRRRAADVSPGRHHFKGELLCTSTGGLPLGFGSHHWRATGSDGECRFVTVDDLAAGFQAGPDTDSAFAALDRAFRTASALRESAGLDFVVSPLFDHEARSSAG